MPFIRRRKGTPPPPVPPKKEEIAALNAEAERLVKVILDVVLEAVRRPGINDVLDWDFWIPAKLVIPLIPESHPQFGHFDAMPADARFYLKWPEAQQGEFFDYEERVSPKEILGHFIAAVLSGDGRLFTALEKGVRLAVRRGRNPGKADNVAGVVAAPPPVDCLKDPNWFSEAVKPSQKSGIPRMIWNFCHNQDKRGLQPTRRDIRNHLEGKAKKNAELAVKLQGINLPKILQRMGLISLAEGGRPRN